MQKVMAYLAIIPSVVMAQKYLRTRFATAYRPRAFCAFILKAPYTHAFAYTGELGESRRSRSRPASMTFLPMGYDGQPTIAANAV